MPIAASPAIIVDASRRLRWFCALTLITLQGSSRIGHKGAKTLFLASRLFQRDTNKEMVARLFPNRYENCSSATPIVASLSQISHAVDTMGDKMHIAPCEYALFGNVFHYSCDYEDIVRSIVAWSVGFSVFCGCYGNAAAQSASTPDERAFSLREVALCRAIQANAERLACFDRAVAALESAERAGEVVVLDRAQIRETNRRLFGFEIANPFVGRTDVAAEPALDSIETTLIAARVSSDGKWIFRLADGSEWRQIDSGEVRIRNRAEEEVRVRRAALGSYMMTVGSSRAIRVRRQ